MKEIKDDTEIGLEDAIVKKTPPPKAIYRPNTIPSKFPRVFFTELEQKFLSLYGDTKDPNSQSIPKKEKQS